MPPPTTRGNSNAVRYLPGQTDVRTEDEVEVEFDRNGIKDRSRDSTSICCNCFGNPRRLNKLKCLSRTSSSGMDEMSDVCPHERNNSLVDQLARIEIGPGDIAEGDEKNKNQKKKCNGNKRQEMIRMRSLEGNMDDSAKEKSQEQFQEYELADDAIDELGDDEREETENDHLLGAKKQTINKTDKVGGDNIEDDDEDFVKIGCDTKDTPRKTSKGKEELPVGILRNSVSIDAQVILRAVEGGKEAGSLVRDKFATFPRMKRRKRVFTNRISLKNNGAVKGRQVKGKSTVVPTRKTKDGTSIFYWCDVANGSRPAKGDAVVLSGCQIC